MSILRPVDKCDRCHMTISNTDMVIVGMTSGKHKDTWWKLCPRCHIYLYKKYVTDNMNVTREHQATLGMDENDIKHQAVENVKIWGKF